MIRPSVSVGRETRVAWLCTCLAIVAAAPAVAWDSTEAEVEEAHRLAGVETPHTPWARPLAGGPVRAYAFVGVKTEGMNTHAWEIAELAQRVELDLDASWRYSFHKDHWFGGDAGERRIVRLLQKPHEVFVFQDVHPNALGTSAMQDGRTPFLEQVRAGAGVVLIGVDVLPQPAKAAKPAKPGAKEEPPAPQLFAEALAIDPIPAPIEAAGGLAAYEYGAGRIVQMPARPKIAYALGWEVDYDLWQEKLARAVLWAAKREPPVGLEIRCEPEVGRDRLAAMQVAVAWKNATPGKTEIALRLRRDDGAETALGTAACKAADGEATFAVPASRAGRHHVDAVARIGQASQGWATQPLVITAPVRVAGITLDERHPLPSRPQPGKAQNWQEDWERRGVFVPYAEVGEPIAGSVTLDGDLKNLVLRMSLFDPQGRELRREERPAAAEQKFSFTAEPSMPMLVRVEARLLAGKDEVAHAWRFQRITQRKRGKFNTVLWSLPGDETLGPHAIARLAELGVTAGLEHTAAPINAAAHGMSYVPWSGGGGGVIAQSAEEWAQPDHGKRFADMVALKSRGHGVLCYSLGDEIVTQGMGKGPKTDDGFQRYLRETYGDVGGLNAAWGTSFGSFDDVTVAAARTRQAELAKADPDNHAVAYDLFYFPGWNFIQMGKNARDWIRKACDDPHAGIGFEGSGHIARGMCDPELVCREFDMWVPYTSISEEFVRSIAPRKFLRSSWIGYDRDATNHCSHAWRQVMMGADSIWYWMWSTIGGWQGFQSPNLVPPEPVREMLGDTRVVREGLGDLLLASDMQHDGVAVLYSYPSIFVGGRDQRLKSYLSHWAAYLAWQMICHDLQLQYDFVTETDLRADDFAARGYKVLVLPQVWAVSDEAAAAIRRFAEAGGTVLADVRPGFFDGHGRRRAAPALDDLFGAKGDLVAAARGELAIAGDLSAAHGVVEKLEFKRPLPVARPETENVGPLIDPSVTATTGKPLGTAGAAAACVVNDVGKGRAILLNAVPRSCFPVRDDTGGLNGQPTSDVLPADAAAFFLNLFHAVGVERTLHVLEFKKEKTPWFGNVRVQRWRDGDYTILGLFRQIDTRPARASVIFGSEKWPLSPERKASGLPTPEFPWVYDIKHDLPSGQTQWFIDELQPGRATFHAILPGPLAKMRVEMPETAARGDGVKVRLAVPEARGRHAIRLTATRPDGSPARFWEQNLIVDREPVEVVLPVAFNDPAGAWSLTFRDVFGSETAVTRRIAVE
jgi:beta-galactosidase